MITASTPSPTPSKMTLESLKFHLIRNESLTDQDQVRLGEMIDYLIESLEEADRAHADKAENLLVRIGEPTIPALINGLKSPHKTVKAVCAMALIRLGEVSIEAVQQFYVRQMNLKAGRQRTTLIWIAEFILAELGESLPVLEDSPEAYTSAEHSSPLSRVS